MNQHFNDTRAAGLLTLVGSGERKGFSRSPPLRTELMKMVHASHDQLGHDAEAESLGFNGSRIHPDAYMNELLVGMRTIHQVLPAILKKLEIFDEFQIDGSDLRLGN
ncbi:hypothetical protein [Stenotrophomonas sp. Iso1]|uniref:hypothetical protein n=1 Tax=Stenotrophomonas sp. Iso1 TaxID=2977283 RepID=UPI0022B7C4AF|nr:hypothetical protein [Stenotrophomonas sp. Iso1]